MNRAEWVRLERVDEMGTWATDPHMWVRLAHVDAIKEACDFKGRPACVLVIGGQDIYVYGAANDLHAQLFG